MHQTRIATTHQTITTVTKMRTGRGLLGLFFFLTVTFLPTNIKVWLQEGNMEKMELIAPCHFGLEAVLKREIYDLGYEIASVEDGRVSFYGDAEAICRANIFLRTAERVLLKVGSFKAETFDELFEQTKKLPWEN